ncbi:hypothetical protein E2562_010343 [Oryza meyeriana var. granulata]|uniref:Uncharacterized protein n=1 Tax=Oryza meyeriana var. granulata TaxID=110450 RepID=A0A6G1F6B2_9ORYZ|nr:hypothetical protein E2562_010343 [Oryza meyeriana var. granulata]
MGGEGLDSQSRFPFPFRSAVHPLLLAPLSRPGPPLPPASGGNVIILCPRDLQCPRGLVSNPLLQPVGIEV